MTDATAASQPAPGGKNVRVEFEDGIAWVILNRPEKRNAMSPALNREMLGVLDALEVDDRCRILVLTGAGDSFSAGMDLKEYFRETDNQGPIALMRVQRDSMGWQWRRLMFFPKPTIAMVNGWCFGGAFTPLVACDLAIAAEEATFGLSEINWGIIPAGNVMRAVTEKMAPSDALYYLMTGENFDGKKANETRLVNEVVPRAQLRERTKALAQKLMQKNPHVQRAIKLSYRRVKEMSWDVAEDYLYAKAGDAYASDPERGREKGMTQFLDDKSFRPGLDNYKR
ncbi:MAG: p-hydroxycinnamoyl CoA hydratase/lyase [Betaproteobacteria bacterium RBG_16_64_9]|nr:MAG: p-hydroxycinnamoyl CoA hydratase/lyase [Betaproteobacteria bacterium RBG_16_64_9]